MWSFVSKCTRQRNWIRSETKLHGFLPTWSHKVRKHCCFVSRLLYPCGTALSGVWDLQSTLLVEKSERRLTYLEVDTVVLEDMVQWYHFIITLSRVWNFLISFMAEGQQKRGIISYTSTHETLVLQRNVPNYWKCKTRHIIVIEYIYTALAMRCIKSFPVSWKWLWNF